MHGNIEAIDISTTADKAEDYSNDRKSNGGTVGIGIADTLWQYKLRLSE